MDTSLFFYGMKITLPIDACEIERKNYHLFIELIIDNKPCRLLIDTGASKTVFDKERVLQFVKEKRIKKHESKSIGLGAEAMETQAATLKHIQISKALLSKWKVAILPIAHVNETYQQLGIPTIDGVLGSDFLMKYDTIISFKKRKLTLNVKIK